MKYSLVLFLLLLAVPAHAASITYTTVFNSVNYERTNLGLNPLRHNAVLDKVAKDRLNDMVSNGYFAHKSPTGQDEWTWFKKEGYKFVYAAENLARYFKDTSPLVRAWMNSPTHRINIVNPVYTETGIATNGVIVVQEFGSTLDPTSKKTLSQR